MSSLLNGRARLHRHAPCISHALNLSWMQNFKPHDDESDDSDDDSGFGTFIEELGSNLYYLIAYA